MGRNLTFRQVSWETYRTQAAPLWRDHFAEVGDKSAALEVNEDIFREAEAAHALCVVGGYDQADELQAYMVFFIQRHLHSRALVVAVEDAHYVRPAYRGSGLKQLIEGAKPIVAAMGVTRMTLHVKIGAGEKLSGLRILPVLQRWGFWPRHVVLCLDIDHG